MKYFVYGDVGGHAGRLKDSLRSDVGVCDLVIPKGTTVIQLGDLIHKGPGSDELVALVDELMLQNNADPERGNWRQLIGNHESQYILAHPQSPFRVPSGAWFWNDVVSSESFTTMLRWWDEGSMTSHFFVEDKKLGTVLITHAGLSYYFLRTLMGKPLFSINQPKPAVSLQDVRAAMRTATSLNRTNPDYLGSSGMMLGGLNLNAGIIWAESSNEVYDTWENVHMPVHQIHGHSTPFNWWDGKFYQSVPLYIQRSMDLDKEQRVSRFDVDGGSFYGIDPGYGKRAPWVLHPFVLES